MNLLRSVVRAGQPGDLVFVEDVERPCDADGGWVVGFVHGKAPNETDLVVLDAADLAPVARVRVHRHIPYGAHSTWVPSTD
jgi:carotenoid cleavage dioxygenase